LDLLTACTGLGTIAWLPRLANLKIKTKKHLIILEALADHSIWIWHAFFSMLGSNNDVNVLDKSLLINNMLQGPSWDLSFTVNKKDYSWYYLLVDGIYPPWSYIVQTIHTPHDEKRACYIKMQESG
jgi:hypothetical protein